MNELLRNGSGYVDMTAYKALKNLERNVIGMDYQRGEIFEFKMKNTGEIKKALIVSANFRANKKYLNIIVLNDTEQTDYDVEVVCQGMMYAPCEMLSLTTADRLGEYIKRATGTEMEQIDESIMRCLGIEQKTVEVPTQHTGYEEFKEIDIKTSKKVQQIEELASAKAEVKIYKDLYEKLLEKVMG